MGLSLFINNLGQKFLRQQLQEKNILVPNQQGKMINNPTLNWVFKLFRRVVKVRVQYMGKVKEVIQGIGATQAQIIKCLGDETSAIYGFP